MDQFSLLQTVIINYKFVKKDTIELPKCFFFIMRIIIIYIVFHYEYKITMKIIKLLIFIVIVTLI